MTAALETAFGPQPAPDGGVGDALLWAAEPAQPGDPVAAMAARAFALGAARPTGALRPLALDQDGGTLRMTMAAPSRAPLAAMLEAGPPPLSVALDIAVALTEAVLALHERRLVHGHLSPVSVFADAGGVEVALHPDSFRARLDTVDQIAGRGLTELACLAPEQTGRTAHRTDRRCDLYALGAILQHLLTGRPVFAPQDRLALIHQHLAVTPPAMEGAPCALAAIVARLLQKAPEKRYQTAFGLLADLRRCRDALRDGGAIGDFAIALQDDRAAFRLPQRLYGRTEHMALLSDAYAAGAGRAELVLIGGYSGAGKSALVRAFIDSVPEAMALTGKYDQIQTLPYKAIQEALRSFVQRLIAQSESARVTWRARFTACLGESAEVLVDFLPELALIVGPQPAPEKMEAAERDQRFKIATQRLFELLATPERPAILFLDDLQWADAASLALIENILTTGDMPGLTIIGAYRENEVGGGHGLRRMSHALAEAGILSHDITVGPLSQVDTARLTADTLGLEAGDVAELAEAVHGKTQGNPFHVRQLLATLHEEDAISFEAAAEAWRWDMPQVRARVVHADIAALMAARIDRLGADAAETLRLAACFGAQFTEAALSIVDDRDEMARRRGLTEVEAEGLIVQADSAAGGGALAFSHDRVQEAAYARLTERERATIHHRIGVWLLGDIRSMEEDDRLFAALDQIGQGLAMVRDPALGRRITAATLVAARRAKAVAAYDLAQRCLATVAKLPPAISGVSWSETPDTAYRLEIERLEADFLLQGFEAARPRFDALMVNLTDDRRKAQVHQLLVTLFTFRSDYRSAIAYGVDGLNLLGVGLSGPYGPKIGVGLAITQAQLLRHDVYDFSQHPRMQNPAVEQIMEMLLILSTPAFLENKDLFVLISLKMFSLTLRHGMTHAGVASICYYALVNYIAFGAVNRASKIIENLFPLFDSFEVSSHVRGRVNYTYAMVVGWHHDSYGELLTRLEANIEHSWKAADLEYVGYYFFGILKYHFVMGRPLGEISARLTEIDRYQRRLRHDVLSGLHDSYASFIAHATGPADAPLWSADDVTLEGRMHGEASKGGFYQAYFLLAQVFGDLRLAADLYRKLAPLESFTILGPDFADYHLCGVLLHTRAGDALPADLAGKRARRLKKHVAQLERLARKYPANHRPHHALALAELARIDRGAAALPLYEEAARLARQDGLAHYAALACELGAACAGEELGAERDRLIKRAHALYDGWGATRKTAALVAAHPGLFAETGAARGMQGGDALDLDTLIKASKAIFESLDFETLLIRLMAIAVENAGADFGALFVVEPDGPHLAVEARIEDGKLAVAVTPGMPALRTLHPGRHPREIVASVAATGTPINLSAGDGAFAATRYIMSRQPRSAVCLPVARSGQTEAIIYLENSLTIGVFTPARREMLQTVASLAAISLSNARLYAQQEQALALEKRATEELSRLNELKDSFLANTSHELRTPLNGIIGLADSMIGGIDGELPERALDTLALIVNSGRRLSSLVNDILDFSRLKENELVLTHRPVDLHSAVDVVASLIGPKARQNKVAIFNEVDPALPAVLADEDRLQQILLNLVDNGVKFAAPGEVRISAEVRGERVHVSVADDGPGIPPDDRDRIFRSFEQADASIQRGHGGAGLGLTITRKLVELHGGAVALDTAPGGGALFSFDLALAAEPAAPAEPVALSRIFAEREPDLTEVALTKAVLKTPARKASGPRHRALVVDDDPVNLQVLKNYLELNNYEAMLAGDGPEALEMLDGGYEPDIVLLDVMMPKMSGYEVCRAIRRRNSANRLPIIMLTAKNRVDDLEIAFDAGANDYLAKPFSRDELFARMRTNIDLSKINIAYERFVPVEFLRFLARRSIIDIELGDNTEKKMSVMFTDIRAFTTLAEQMTPNESFAFISDYFRRLGPLVRENEGFLNQYLGDGMMALFPRNPDDAVKAAIGIQQELDRFNAERARRSEAPIETGIGLHSGDLVLGIIGDKHRRSGNVVSDAVNLASRIEGLTGHYGIRIAASREMIQQLRSPADVPHRELDIVWVKGKDKPVAVCEIFAGDPPESIALKTRTKPAFEGAVAAYRAGAFAEARDAFAEVIRANPDDNVAQIFFDRCARYIESGAPAAWAGIETIA